MRLVFGKGTDILPQRKVSVILAHYASGKLNLKLIETWEAFKTIPQPPSQYSQTGQAAKVTSVNWLQRHNSSQEGQRFIVSSYLWHGVM